MQLSPSCPGLSGTFQDPGQRPGQQLWGNYETMGGVCSCVHVCMHLCVSVCLYVCLCMSLHVSLYLFVLVCVERMSVCDCVCICVCMKRSTSRLYTVTLLI